MSLLLERRIEDGAYSPTEAYEMVRAWALAEGLDDPGPPPESDRPEEGDQPGEGDQPDV
jgi:hypothetical protein